MATLPPPVPAPQKWKDKDYKGFANPLKPPSQK